MRKKRPGKGDWVPHPDQPPLKVVEVAEKLITLSNQGKPFVVNKNFVIKEFGWQCYDEVTNGVLKGGFCTVPGGDYKKSTLYQCYPKLCCTFAPKITYRQTEGMDLWAFKVVDLFLLYYCMQQKVQNHRENGILMHVRLLPILFFGMFAAWQALVFVCTLYTNTFLSNQNCSKFQQNLENLERTPSPEHRRFLFSNSMGDWNSGGNHSVRQWWRGIECLLP